MQAGLSLCLLHIPHCWESHVAAHMCLSGPKLISQAWLTIILTFNGEMFHITIITHHTHIDRVALTCGGWNTISMTTVSSCLTIILTFNGEMFHITIITHHTHVHRVTLHLCRLEYYIHDNCIIMDHNNTYL